MAPASHTGGNLWGGRFSGSMDERVAALNNSLAFDRRLWPYDVQGSIAHATMLGECGILPVEDADAIVVALQTIARGLAAGTQVLDPAQEDVHSAIEALLREMIGAKAGMLHTARSRNDQVATDTRLYVCACVDWAVQELAIFQSTLLTVADREREVLLPGFTHLQHAQPILLSHHVLAYFWMLQRDRVRFVAVRASATKLPLGAGALAGTPFPINRARTAELLGFEGVCENSMDAVSDRDFVLEYLSSASILMVHLSRLAEEIILWNSPEFGWVELDDSVTTGSSIMPQKKNPDVAELARGKCGRVFGHLQALLVTMKGLPLAYNKDMQEDKEGLFDTVDTLEAVLPAMRLTIETARFHSSKMAASVRGDFSTATDLADLLARQGLPFREAHELVGGIVRDCIAAGRPLEDLSSEEFAAYHPLLAEDGCKVVRPETSIRARNSEGGSAPDAVSQQIAYARATLHGSCL